MRDITLNLFWSIHNICVYLLLFDYVSASISIALQSSIQLSFKETKTKNKNKTNINSELAVAQLKFNELLYFSMQFACELTRLLELAV